jgi:hypothetical protein
MLACISFRTGPAEHDMERDPGGAERAGPRSSGDAMTQPEIRHGVSAGGADNNKQRSAD